MKFKALTTALSLGLMAGADRVEGTSKMSKKIVFEALLMVWGLLFANGLRRSPRLRSKLSSLTS
jgi:hypothetical protein